MSIIIKGMDMPTSCWGCEIFSSCPTGSLNECLKYVESRNPNCPLVEVPTPHGRLVEGDVVANMLRDILTYVDEETILEAEE